MPAGVFTQIVGWCGCVLMALLLARAVMGRTLKRYPSFYTYVAYVLLTSVWVLCVYSPGAAASAYSRFYWTSQLIALLLGVGVLWEIHIDLLTHYSGIRRLTRILISMFLLAVTIRSLISIPVLPATVVQLERNLRTVQAVLLVTLLGIIAYYSIPVGRNLRGIIMGYGLFLSTAILNLSFSSYCGRAFDLVWTHVQPIEYCVSLTIWCASLWNYHPNAIGNAGSEQDYKRLSNQTLRALTRLRGQLLQVGRL